MSKNITHLTAFFIIGTLFQIDVAFAIKCELFGTHEQNQEGPEMGVIFIPGAQISGETYAPLAQELIAQFPGNVWVGLTEDWWITMPNPIQIGAAIDACFSEAELSGYNTDSVFLAGHSLGGVVLESYISNHMTDNVMGLILFGSYLPDLPSTNNTFPVPVLSAVGTLDGLTLSIAFREYRESRRYNETRFDDPVLLVEDANHGQVASGELPIHVIKHDIDPVIDSETAHTRYATTAVTFMITARTTRNQFPEDVVQSASLKLDEIKLFTKEFFSPFVLMAIQEDLEENGVRTSPWMVAAQFKLLGDFEVDGPDLTELTVTTELVPASDIGEVKPQVIDSNIPCKKVTVTTFSHNRYYWDPTEHDHLQSTEVMKAKFKLSDDVFKHLCVEYEKRWQCKDINQEAFDLARSVASEKALERYDTDGIQLIFTDDYQTSWGPGWEFDRGLKYTKVNETHTNVTATSLISPVAFKTHYCDLMTPFRALEWIYIGGVKHGPIEL